MVRDSNNGEVSKYLVIATEANLYPKAGQMVSHADAISRD